MDVFKGMGLGRSAGRIPGGAVKIRLEVWTRLWVASIDRQGWTEPVSPRLQPQHWKTPWLAAMGNSFPARATRLICTGYAG